MAITESAIRAIEAMKAAGIPAQEFDPALFDFIFSRRLTFKEQRQAAKICKKYMSVNFTFSWKR